MISNPPMPTSKTYNLQPLIEGLSGALVPEEPEKYKTTKYLRYSITQTFRENYYSGRTFLQMIYLTRSMLRELKDLSHSIIISPEYGEKANFHYHFYVRLVKENKHKLMQWLSTNKEFGFNQIQTICSKKQKDGWIEYIMKDWETTVSFMKISPEHKELNQNNLERLLTHVARRIAKQGRKQLTRKLLFDKTDKVVKLKYNSILSHVKRK